MATYPLPGRAARWARLPLRVALVVAVALSDVVLLAPPQGAQASRPEQAGDVSGDAESRLGPGV